MSLERAEQLKLIARQQELGRQYASLSAEEKFRKGAALLMEHREISMKLNPNSDFSPAPRPRPSIIERCAYFFTHKLIN